MLVCSGKASFESKSTLERGESHPVPDKESFDFCKLTSWKSCWSLKCSWAQIWFSALKINFLIFKDSFLKGETKRERNRRVAKTGAAAKNSEGD